MVKGIRAHKAENAGNRHAESEFIGKCMAEIKEELKTNFPDVKAVAIQKLIYVQHTDGGHHAGGARRGVRDGGMGA